ncbi:L-fuculose phosphate aldolase [Limihaloglobus sulfuriphilus]|uniref:L-fuculose phosphate aldolase n=1 Tax=Limihaloglobus sulfuriphilus TaxID=1851148 RepID=A0A1Q2MHN3_9BACT|nr:class II aldolase/adducin family protein [Limihaloglobus sulfuriphilus]AQQ72159.1 L-fuculose phosphate aldolase [Limihaloglobus sulfuriphilus]
MMNNCSNIIMTDNLKQYDLTPLAKACRKAASFDLFKCSSGNMSWRIDDSHMAVTATRSWLGELTAEQVALCRLIDGETLNKVKPTVEARFHLGILRCRPEMNVVLHFQSRYATAVACGDSSSYNFNVIPEIPYYIGKIGIVPFLPPGSPELAEAVIEQMKTHNLAVMRNHGLVTVAENFNMAIQNAVFFELACSVLLTQPNPVYIDDSWV